MSTADLRRAFDDDDDDDDDDVPPLGAIGATRQVLEETGSTMDDAWRALDAGAGHGHVVVADRQRAGRGSHGRTWTSPGGTDLYFSVLLRERGAPRPTMTLGVALAVAEVADHVVAQAATHAIAVKWPNDVLADDAKLAGILCESRSRDGCFDAVIGVGLNVNRLDFDRPGEATSLRRIAGAELDRGRVLRSSLVAIEWWLAAPAPRVAAALDERLAWRGERVRCDDVEGELLGVAADGALRLRTASGERRLHAGRTFRIA